MNIIRMKKTALFLYLGFFSLNSYGMSAVLKEAQAKDKPVMEVWTKKEDGNLKQEYLECTIDRDVCDFLTEMKYLKQEQLILRTGPNGSRLIVLRAYQFKDADKQMCEALQYLLEYYKVADLLHIKPLHTYGLIVEICNWILANGSLINHCKGDPKQVLLKFQQTHNEGCLVLRNDNKTALCSIASNVARFFPNWSRVGNFQDASIVFSENLYGQASFDFFKTLLYALYNHAPKAYADYLQLERTSDNIIGENLYVEHLKNFVVKFFNREEVGSKNKAVGDSDLKQECEEINFLEVFELAHKFGLRIIVQALIAASKNLPGDDLESHLGLEYYPLLIDCETDQYRIFLQLNAKVKALTATRKLSDEETAHVEECLEIITNALCRNNNTYRDLFFRLCNAPKTQLHPQIEQIFKQKLMARYVPSRTKKVADLSALIKPLKAINQATYLGPERISITGNAANAVFALQENSSLEGVCLVPTLLGSIRYHGNYAYVPRDAGCIWIDNFERRLKLSTLNSQDFLCILNEKGFEEFTQLAYFEQDQVKDRGRTLVVCSQREVEGANNKKTEDDTIQVYDLGAINAPAAQAVFIQELEQTEKSHHEECKQLLATPQYIIAAFYQKRADCPNKLRVWDSRTFKCVSNITLPKGDRSVNCLSLLSENRIAVGIENVVHVVDLATKKNSATIQPKSYRKLDESVSWIAEINKDHIAVCHKKHGFDKGFINIWNIATQKCVKTIYRDGHASPLVLARLNTSTIQVLYSDGHMYRYYIRECGSEDNGSAVQNEDFISENKTVADILSWMEQNKSSNGIRTH